MSGRDGGAAFEADGLLFRYPGAERPALRDVSLRVRRGELYGIVGPNGSGKSTLLRVLLGSLTPGEGRVTFDGRPPEAWERRALARRVGVVPQREEVAFPLRVRDFVAMGRYPHLGPWRAEGEEDRAAVRAAMERCDLAGLADRAFATLSGGERQQARVARARAQEPEALVLDEPAVSLDLRHEMEILGLLGDLVADGGVTVLLVTHHLNAAARSADRLLLLEEGRSTAEGPPAEVLTREAVERAWKWPVRVTRHPGPGPDAGAPQVVPLHPNGEGLSPVPRGLDTASDEHSRNDERKEDA